MSTTTSPHYVKSLQLFKGFLLGVCFVMLSIVALNSNAQVGTNLQPLAFANPVEEQRFHALVSELRCVMCQNQSLADSNAQIAYDLRREVLQLMQQGHSDDAIKRFLVARYGEFILYQPALSKTTWLLWFGPLILVVAGVIIIVKLGRNRSVSATVRADDRQEW